MLTWIKSLFGSLGKTKVRSDQFSEFFKNYRIRPKAQATIRDMADFASEFTEEGRRITCRLHCAYDVEAERTHDVQMEIFVNHIIRQTLIVKPNGRIGELQERELDTFKLAVGMRLASVKSV